MSDNKKNDLPLSDDELWQKCQQGGSISAQDLGVSNTSSSNGINILSEGTNYVTFELSNQIKRKK